MRGALLSETPREQKNPRFVPWLVVYEEGISARRVNIHLDSSPDGIIEPAVDPRTTWRSLADCDADFSYDLGQLGCKFYSATWRTSRQNLC